MGPVGRGFPLRATGSWLVCIILLSLNFRDSAPSFLLSSDSGQCQVALSCLEMAQLQDIGLLSFKVTLCSQYKAVISSAYKF